MPAMAAQQAPKKAADGAKRSAEPPRRPQEKAGLKDRLYRLPQAAGAAILAVLLVISLFAGNFRALQNATPKAFWRYGDVQSIVEDRMDAANNACTVAARAQIDAALADGVRRTMEELEAARTAQAISRADQKLTVAVSDLIAAAGDVLTGEDARMLAAAADDFAEQGSFLRQEARAYNAEAERAEALYEKLPTRFALPQPDVYEGI